MPSCSAAWFSPCSCNSLKLLSLKRPTSLIRHASTWLWAVVVVPPFPDRSSLPLPHPAAATSSTTATGMAHTFMGVRFRLDRRRNVARALEHPVRALDDRLPVGLRRLREPCGDELLAALEHLRP